MEVGPSMVRAIRSTASGVGADDRIADARQRDLQTPPLLLDQTGDLLGRSAGGGLLGELPGDLLRLLAGGQVTGDLGEAAQAPPLVLEGRDDDVGPEP